MQEVLVRSAVHLIKDGLIYLSEDESQTFDDYNIKKCIVHYIT